MKILQVPPRFYPYVGGVENFVLDLSRALTREGHEVTVVCADEPRTGDQKIEGIRVRRLSWAGKISNTNITPGLPFALSAVDCDVIHAHLPTPWSADWAGIISRCRGKPFFLTYHNDIPGTGLLRAVAYAYNQGFLPFLLHSARQIFITQAKYLQRSPFLQPFARKVRVIPPGVDAQRFYPAPVAKDEGKFHIFFLSKLDRFHRYKGLEYLLSALKYLDASVPVVLSIAGDGELLAMYRDWVRQNGLDRVVSFVGRPNGAELLSYYNRCDVFVLPSVSSVQEGFGLVAQEAMACGKPVIVTDIVGVAEAVTQEQAGLVVKPRDGFALAQALTLLWKDPGMRREMGRNALRLALTAYSWQRHAQQLLGSYRGTA